MATSPPLGEISLNALFIIFQSTFPVSWYYSPTFLIEITLCEICSDFLCFDLQFWSNLSRSEILRISPCENTICTGSAMAQRWHICTRRNSAGPLARKCQGVIDYGLLLAEGSTRRIGSSCHGDIYPTHNPLHHWPRWAIAFSSLDSLNIWH